MTPKTSTPKTLPDILTTQFGIFPETVFAAQKTAALQGGSLAGVLIKKKQVPEKTVLQAMSLLYDLPFVSRLETDRTGAGVVDRVPIHFLKTYFIVPLLPDSPDSADDLPIIAVNDPDALQAVDDLASLLHITRYRLVLSTRGEILSAINNLYERQEGHAQKIVDDMEDDERIISEMRQTSDLLDDTSDVPIIKLVNHIISQSVKAKASDIHMEPGHETLKVRYRIDGILYDLIEPPKWAQSALITRIKVMADMDIAEKRLPQDSRIEVRIGNRDIDIRISTIPTALGERVVLRLLDKSGSLLTLSQFGISQENLEMIRHLCRLPNGIILMTGPTGSGKTTTLYAMLSEINHPDINIITVEDPVEYKLDGISQIQVNTKIGLTFARSLRAIVRQDPDVILIGEIRDQETASIAIQSALTGHLVLSTLHTNDSAGAITRLVDIGIEPFLITSAVRAVIAQRLVRILCDHCKDPYVPDEATLARLGLDPEDCRHQNVFRATGCHRCIHTGYRGRMPIFEILVLEQHHKSLILSTSDTSKIRQHAIENNMKTLMQDGIEKVFAGITTVEEVLRVTQV
jgi:general secretion pathway protein E